MVPEAFMLFSKESRSYPFDFNTSFFSSGSIVAADSIRVKALTGSGHIEEGGTCEGVILKV